MTTPRHACERCGRPLAESARCAQHPGARRLDLRRAADREWQADLLQLRRQRWLRLASFAGVGGTALGGLVLLALFLYGGAGARVVVRELGVVPVVVAALQVALLAAQGVAVGLALLNLGRWLRNAWSRRSGGRQRDPMAWRKAPYVAGTLIYGVIMAAGLHLGQLAIDQPLQHLILAGLVALGVSGVMLLIDVIDLANRQLGSQQQAALPEPTWESWRPVEALRVPEQTQR